MIEDKHLKKHCSLYFLLFFFLTKVHAMKKTKDVCRKVYYSASISKKTENFVKEKCSSFKKQMHFGWFSSVFCRKEKSNFLETWDHFKSFKFFERTQLKFQIL